MRLAVIASHPIQYYAPLFRELARSIELKVFFAHRATPADQADAGFGVAFDWDSDLLSGYEHAFLANVAKRPALDRFAGCDTPAIGKELAAGKFDAVLTQGWHLKCFVQAGFAAKRLRLPLLVRGDSQLETPRGAVKKIIKQAAYPALLRLFDAALFVGERSRAYWRHYGYPENRLFFSPHAVDAAWFAEKATSKAREELRARLGLGTETKVLLFAGKLVPFKRPLDVVEAAAAAKQAGRDVAVMIAGAGMLRTEIVARAAARGVPLHDLGFCNQTEMPAAYAAADILVLPSDARETWGLVANEALACGRPIVLAETVGSAPDLAADGTAGEVFPLGDVAALSAATCRMMVSPPSPIQIAAKSATYSLTAAAQGIADAAEWAKRARGGAARSVQPATRTRLRVR